VHREPVPFEELGTRELRERAKEVEQALLDGERKLALRELEARGVDVDHDPRMAQP
jgi:hypothetical protein